MAKTLFLLDGFALIYRAYFAFYQVIRKNSKGENISTLYGFTSTLLDIIKKYNPDAIAVAFEHPEGNFREEIYSDYKAQRDTIPEDIVSSLDRIFLLLETMNIPALSIKNYEADDVIGAAAKQAEKDGYKVYMVTPDKDFSQLVTENVRILKPTSRGLEEMGPKEVCERYSLKQPLQMIDYLGLVGDASDNVPGCKGIGEKSAKTLLADYNTIEEIYNNIEKVKPSFQKKLLASKADTLLSKELVTIVTHIPNYAFDFDEFSNWSIHSEAVLALLKEFEFSSLINRYYQKNQTQAQPSLFDSTLALSENSAPKTIGNKQKPLPSKAEEQSTSLQQRFSFLSFKAIPMNYTVVDDEKKQAELWQTLANAHHFAFDTETTSLDTFQAELVAMSFCTEPGKAFFLPIPENRLEAIELLAPLNELMQNQSILKVAQNAKYDTKVLSKYGITFPQPLFDTLIAHYLVDSDRKHSLDAMAEEYFSHTMIPYSSLSDKKDFTLRNDVPTYKLAIYAAEDADVTLRLHLVLDQLLKEEQQTELFNKVEMPLVPVLKEMEEIGVKFDPNALSKVEQALDEQATKLAETIYNEAGETFNINSPIQVGSILFEKLAIDRNPKRTKKGGYATGEDVLSKYATSHPIVNHILQYRGVTKLLNTYVRTLPSYVHSDGRIHCNFNQTITATGRLSSSDPNLQNIPIRSEIGQEIRAAFVPSNSEYVFLSADYSQIELRLAAHMSEDCGLINAFKEGTDIHQITAAKLYHIKPTEVTNNQRAFAKQANFGILYGITYFGLSQRLQIPVSEAKKLKDDYLKAFPKILTFTEEAINKAHENGYAETMLGRRRYLSDIYSENNTVRSSAERNAINTPIQGTAADLIKIAMVRISQRMKHEGMKSRMILQIHDELNFDALKCEVEKLKGIVEEEMINALGELKVPLEVSVGVGNNWLEAH